MDEAASAYRSAQALHDLRVDYDAVSEFDSAQPVYNPRSIQALLSENDIDVRLAVLAAFQCYARTLVAITDGTDSPELEAASRSAGDTLSGLGNLLAPSIQSTFGVASSAASSTSTAADPPITPQIQNGISTAVNALGQFLVSRKIKKELPGKIKEMDPYLQTLCHLLENDIDVLEDQQKRDYDSIINRQTLFVRESRELNPEQRRVEIMKLPEIVRQQRSAQEQLVDLRASIARLSLTHAALLAAAESNNPESLKSKISELEVAGVGLGKFYASSPAQ